MPYLINTLLDKIEAINPQHADKLRSNLEYLRNELQTKSETFLKDYEDYLIRNELTLDYGVSCYLKMINDMVAVRYEFYKTGDYSNSSFQEVERQIYANPEVMTYHMHGLVLAQYLWFDQYERIHFFSENLLKFCNSKGSYLEIGGGHGLYLKEAMNMLPEVTRFDMVDISESSLALAKGIINNERPNFYHKNVFDFDEKIKYDFITIGEVLEHVEDPLSLMKKIASLMNPSSVCFMTTPINAPMIDHIFLFNEAAEIRSLIDEAGFDILIEKMVLSEKVSEERAKKLKLPVMYATFIKQKEL
ncbi:class I SAM-dependent methyltransferase [Ekhidna sp.]|uniref:class I SAM-dependent methyltransferase n=1 Tax=Ekhidna sp. TaxID=2608089 RepID=UPI003B4FFFB9